LSLVSLITKEHFVTGSGVAYTMEHFVVGVTDTKDHLSLVSPMPKGNFLALVLKTSTTGFLSGPKSQQVLRTQKMGCGFDNKVL
jgi:hypothetical protein